MPVVRAMEANLQIVHELYTLADAQRTRSRDLYGGTPVVQAKSTTYLLKGKNESAEDYAIRLKRAVLDNYVEKIVEARQSVLFKRDATRELSPKLGELIADVDTRSTSADIFFRDVARDAQIDGLRWVLVDMPRIATPVVSAADEQRLGVRPFFQSVPATSVLDWSFGDDGKLDWAVIREVQDTKREPGSVAAKSIQYLVWARDTWKRYEQKSSTSAPELIASDPNFIGMVPLVPFYGIKVDECFGLPVCISVLDHVLLIYNKQSDLDWFERLSCHPIPYVISPKKPEKLDVGGGLHIASAENSGSISIGYLETSGTGETSVRDSIDRLERKIYAIALAQAKRDGKQVQSADGQREDRQVFTSSLMSVSRQLEAAEAQCWNIAAAWLKDQGVDVVVSYNRDFDDRAIDDAMLAELSTMVDQRKLSLKTFLDTLEYADLLPNFNAEEEQKLLAAEAKTRAVELLGDLTQANGGA